MEEEQRVELLGGSLPVGLAKILFDVAVELEKARRHGEVFASAHEAHSVMLEELEEFWDHVKLKRKNRCGEDMRKELVQLAAMAVKAIQSMHNFVGGKV